MSSFERPLVSSSENFSFQMPKEKMEQHRCSTVVVGCIDFRFREANDAFVEHGLGEKDFDTLNFPGGGKNFAEETPERELFAQSIERVCVGLHDVQRIVLMNHWDCGAYGGSAHFHSAGEEESMHRADLEKARNYLTQRFPKLEIVIAYNKFEGDNLSFHIIPEESEESEAA